MFNEPENHTVKSRPFDKVLQDIVVMVAVDGGCTCSTCPYTGPARAAVIQWHGTQVQP